MFKTIKYSVKNRPLIDINEQGVVYSYQTKQLKHLKQLKRNCCPYYYWTEGNQNYYVHIEVAKAFPEICGEWFEGCEVHHIDGNSLNNKATNLIVCTREQHLEFHRQLKEKAVRKKYLEVSFDNRLEEFKNKGNYSIKFYCRKSKKNKNGLAPIEVAIYQKGKRKIKNTGYFCEPEDFEKRIYPEGFNEYMFNN